MVDLSKTVHHRVYRTELLGEALVVTLQGDSTGFSLAAVQNEMSTVATIARSPEVRNLIIDMSGGNYYGSVILGEILNLAQRVKDKGGRVALAGLSEDMKEVLRIMRLDAMWERYPTRSMAIRALAQLKWQERLKPYVKPIAIGSGLPLLMLLLVGLYFVIPARQPPTRTYYNAISSLWESGLKLKGHSNDTDWMLYSEQAKEKFAGWKRELNRVANSSRPDLQELLYVVRDHAPKAIDQHLQPDADDTILANYFLASVKYRLDGGDPPERPAQLGPDPMSTITPAPTTTPEE